MTERRKRVDGEPQGNTYLIKVKLPDGTMKTRKFPQIGNYQVEYITLVPRCMLYSIIIFI